MTSVEERNHQTIEQFIAAIVGTGKTEAEARDMIDSQGLTVTQMEQSLDLIGEVLELGEEFMRSRRRPISEKALSFYRLVLSDVGTSDQEVVRKPGGERMGS